MSREAKYFRDRMRKVTIKSADMPLLGPEDRLAEITSWLEVLLLADSKHAVLQRKKAMLAIGLLLGAIALSVAGLVYLPIALAGGVIAFAPLKFSPAARFTRVSRGKSLCCWHHSYHSAWPQKTQVGPS